MKNIIIAVVALIAIAGVYSFVTSTHEGENVGGSTASNWVVGKGRTSTATTSVTVDHAGTIGGCLIMKQSDGTGYGYFYVTSTGSLASTTSAGC